MEERSFASGYDKQLLCSYTSNRDDNRAFWRARAVMKTCTLQRCGRLFDEVQYALRQNIILLIVLEMNDNLFQQEEQYK